MTWIIYCFLFPEHLFLVIKDKCCKKYMKIFSSFNPLGKLYKLRGRYFKINTISLRRGDIPFSLLMSAFLLGIILFTILYIFCNTFLIKENYKLKYTYENYLIKKIKSKNYPTFCYPINKINIYGLGIGILFRSVKSLTLLNYILKYILNQCSVTRS